MRAVRGAAPGTGLAAVGLLLAVALANAETLSREQALAALAKRGDVAARRQGAEGLGETGDMGDVPILTKALRDPDRGVRTLAEQSLWRVWSRSGDPDTDKVLLQGVEEMQRGDLAEAHPNQVDDPHARAGHVGLEPELAIRGKGDRGFREDGDFR